MDGDFSPEALCKRYDAGVRHLARRFRGIDPEVLVQAGHQGVLEARWRYFESPDPLPRKTPFDKAVWSYMRNAMTRAAHEEHPRRYRIDEARHDASLDAMEAYFGSPDRHDFLGGMLDVLGQVAAGTLAEVHADPDAFPADAPTPEERAERRRALLRIAGAIGFLDRSDQQIVNARVVEDRTFVQIAEDMGLNERWVRERYQRALRRLRANLADQQSDQRMIR